MWKTTLFLIIFVITSVTIASEKKNDAAEEENIKAVIAEETNSWKEGNYKNWANTWSHEPYIFWVASGVAAYNDFDSWDALNDAIGETIKNRKRPLDIKVERDNYRIRIFGNGAWATFDQYFIWEEDGVEQKSMSKDFRTLEKVEGKWKIIFMGHISKSDYFDTTFTKVEGYVNALGYKLLQMNKVDEAKKMFALNIEYFPNSWNVYDSMGEVYMKKGEKEKAIENYKKSLELNPKNKSAISALKKLKAN